MSPPLVVSSWPLLFLRFNYVNTIRLSGFSDNGGIQRGISNVEVEHLSDEEVVTEITDHYGAFVSMRHLPLIDALVISTNEDVVELPATSV